MNFLIRPDAEKLLAEDDYRRLWEFFTTMFAATGQHSVADRRGKGAVPQRVGLRADGRLQPTTAPRHCARPPPATQGAEAVTLPREMLTVNLPTQVIWGMNDIALPPALLDGLEDYLPQLQLHRVPDATHWIIHEQPALVARLLGDFISQIGLQANKMLQKQLLNL